VVNVRVLKESDEGIRCGGGTGREKVGFMGRGRGEVDVDGMMVEFKGEKIEK